MKKTAAPVPRFPGLNALRFLAATAVVLSHVELLKQYGGLPSAYERLAVYELGRLSVTFFFVLSGYLITYLLLVEKARPEGIDVRRFYVRRVLRIWPLYYGVVLLAFLVFPAVPALRVPGHTDAVTEHVTRTLPLFLAFLPQLALSAWPPVPYAEPTWSIGVEEQFYLLWPLLLKRGRGFVLPALVVAGATVVARHAALATAVASRADPERLAFWNVVVNYLYFTRLECMAIGGLFAWFFWAGKTAVLKPLYSPVAQWAVYALTAGVLVTDMFKPIFDYGPYAVLFGVVILNVSTNPRSLVRLSGPRLEWLGNLSFSMYMLHEPVVQLTIGVFRRLMRAPFADLASNVALHAVSLLLTVGVAALAYRYFETPFLRLKSRLG